MPEMPENSGTSLRLMAHLMRRAGFGAGRNELEQRASVGYDETVDELEKICAEIKSHLKGKGVVNA